MRPNHGELNAMYKLFLLISCLFLVFIQSGCGDQKAQEIVRAAGGSGNNQQDSGKEDINDVAPTFTENQLQKGQWIEWRRTSPQGAIDCLRWTIVDFPASGIAIEGRISRQISGACQTPDDYFVEHILFNPDSGEIISDSVMIGGSAQANPNPLKTIFNHLYGNKQKVTFRKGVFESGKKKYPAFQLKKHSQVFLNQPHTAFHAFVIGWSEVRNGAKWSYELNQANPPIAPLPTNPSNP